MQFKLCVSRILDADFEPYSCVKTCHSFEIFATDVTELLIMPVSEGQRVTFDGHSQTEVYSFLKKTSDIFQTSITFNDFFQCRCKTWIQIGFKQTR